MSYHHFTICERSRIKGLHQIGYSARKIGLVKGRHHSSISRELKQGNASTYIAEASQQGYETRRTRSKSVGKITDSLVATIEEKTFRNVVSRTNRKYPSCRQAEL